MRCKRKAGFLETKKLLDVTVAKNGKGVEEAVGGSDNQIL